MTHRTYLLPLVLALLLLLSLTACGDSSSDDPQSGYETVMDMEFLDGMWSIDGTSRLYFDSEEGFYAYRTGWGLGGRGEFELSEASGRPMIFFNGLLYNFLLRDDGVLLPNRNGEGSGLTIHRQHLPPRRRGGDRRMGHKQLGRHVAERPGRDHRHRLVPHAVHRLLAGLFHEVAP
ncbi:MAG: hypothetical protein ACLTG0_01230 [Oscillibacter sp.]